MNENILKIGKVLESWITLDLSHKGLLDSKPSVSYIVQSSVTYPPTKNILSSLDGEELVKGLFTSYNLLNGDSDETAISKSEKIYVVDYVKRESDEFYPDVYCDDCSGGGEEQCQNCEGEGEIECTDCDGTGEDTDSESCYKCDGSGNITCEDCDGSGNVECSNCEGEGEVTGDIESVEVEMGTILTQNKDMVEELNRRTEGGNVIDGFEEWVDKYKNEIIICDTIDDVIEYEYEWELGNAEAKLEDVGDNLKNYRISRNTPNITALRIN